MGLFDKRNIDKAKTMALKNKDKIADGVNKATGSIDKKTKGKYSDKLKKVDEAAGKFAGKPGADGPAAEPSTATTASDDETTSG
jgi:hypothetical protein